MLHTHLIIAAIIVALFIIQAVVLYIFVRPIIAKLRASPSSILGTPAANKMKGIRAALVGYKHTLLAFLGSLAIGVPDLLAEVRKTDLTQTPLAAYAGVIGLACFVGMMVFHAIGVRTALNADTPEWPV